ncbi:hypothetical protein BCD70_000253 [Clostridium beijerinckii]|nr:hypothetical protein [Clostridium beijerinckii]
MLLKLVTYILIRDKEGVDLTMMHLVKNRDELTVKRVTNQIAKANFQ